MSVARPWLDCKDHGVDYAIDRKKLSHETVSNADKPQRQLGFRLVPNIQPHSHQLFIETRLEGSRKLGVEMQDPQLCLVVALSVFL